MNQELVNKAREVRNSSYSPYSNFKVGAAVLCSSGQIYLGTNVENASYGLTVCAERVAIFSAVTAGERNITEIAVSVGEVSELHHAMSCGACRQVMQEFSQTDTIVHIDGVGSFKLSELLPKPFELSHT